MKDNPIPVIVGIVILIAAIDAGRWVYSCMKDPEMEYTFTDALVEWWYERVMRIFTGGGGNGGRPTAR